MQDELDRAWAEEGCVVCDPIFAAADVGFARHIREEPRAGITSLLSEADPQRFAARYPDSKIPESYGDQWPRVTCIDFWVYVDGKRSQSANSTEGWSADQDAAIALTGDWI